MKNIKMKLVCPCWHQLSPDRNQLQSYRPPNQDMQKHALAQNTLRSYKVLTHTNARRQLQHVTENLFHYQPWWSGACSWHRAASIKFVTLKSLEGLHVARSKEERNTEGRVARCLQTLSWSADRSLS